MLARLRGVLRRRRLDLELQQEIASHLDEAAEEYVRQGLSPAEARRAAHRHFGSVVHTQEAHRDARSLLWLDHLRRDTRDAGRALARRAGSSALMLTVLALGIGGVTAVFALLNAVVLRPLPFAHPDRLVTITHAAPGLGLDRAGLSSGLYFFYTERARSLDAIGLYTDQRLLNLSVPGAASERIRATSAGWALFDLLGVTPAHGRLFTAEDGSPGFMNMKWTVPVLLGYDFWIDQFGGDPDVVGRVLTLSDNPRRVVGVLPAGLPLPNPDTQVWTLSEPPDATPSFARSLDFHAVARLSAGATPASAEAELAALLPGIEGAYRDATPARIAEVRLAPIVTSLETAMVADVAPVLWPVFGGMLLLLLVAAANAGGLFLVRLEHRRGEMAVRTALGADEGQLARLVVIEALMLSLAAAGAGLVLAKGALSAVIALAPLALPRAAEIRIDAQTVAGATATAVLLAALFGALSFRRHARVSMTNAGRWSTEGRRGARTPDFLIVLQVALALTLMMGSALMLETYRHLSQVELGFAADHLLAVEISLPYRKAGQHARIYRALAERLGRVPGVERAAAVTGAPLTGAEHVFPIESGAVPVLFKFFVAGYFQTMETSILEGASFAPGDPVTTSNPVLVSASLARRLAPGESAVGKTVRRLDSDGSVVTLFSPGIGVTPVPPFTIAGVVSDVRELSLRGAPTDVVYIPIVEPAVERSIVPTNLTLVARTTVPPASLAASVRQAIADVDADVGVGRARTMDAIVRAARGREAFVGFLLLVAAGVALFLGAAGIYGSVSEVVRRRTREIGIRLALGASRTEVVRLVCTRSMRAAVAGTGVGLLVGVVATRSLNAMLFGVEPGDPATLGAVAAGLLAATLVAAVLAARGAVAMPPVMALGRE
jgi:predicted permease